MMDLRAYLQGRKEEIQQETLVVKDYSVFDFSYIPEEPLMREEAKAVIDAFLLYNQTGLPKNMALLGTRGSGKTLMLRFLAKALARETALQILYVNCRNHNTSFKILAHVLHVQARGASFDELFLRFQQAYPGKTVLVLDEVDLISPKDRQIELLYRLSRSRGNYMTILLSNNPRLMQVIDPSARSTLQPEGLHFKNYDAEQIYSILEARAKQGLQACDEEALRRIAALTVRNSNSDVRIAIKSLFYTATEKGLTVEDAFTRASRDVVVDVVQDLNDKCLLILESIRRARSRLTRDIYQGYKHLSESVGEAPFSYMHFTSTLGYLQSAGLVLLVSTKVARTYTNRIRLLFDAELAAETFKKRFA